ncbi:hypothetical protein [Sphingomonas sp. SRS2]|uniref:hypothetical protein n=1 Tax=Sphingomonas sp. SRS2 TaxID=133190 RepID=UPI00128D3AB5|nr:hypothetical protein [Sphingomonas sp. SRS2]
MNTDPHKLAASLTPGQKSLLASLRPTDEPGYWTYAAERFAGHSARALVNKGLVSGVRECGHVGRLFLPAKGLAVRAVLIEEVGK